MKKLFSFLIILLILYSCIEIGEDVYYNISDKDKISFKHNDTIVFICDSNKIDSFIIKISNYDRTYDKVYHEENILLGYFPIDSISYKFIDIQQNYLTVHIWADGNYFPSIDLENTPKQNDTINGKEFLNVYKVERDIYETYYCTKYGILKYTKKDSSIYEIVLK